MQQFAGINTVMYYGATIANRILDGKSGTEHNVDSGDINGSEGSLDKLQKDIWLSCGFAFVNFVFTVVGIALVERVGRRRLVLGSLSAVSLCLATLGFAFRLGSMSLAITATLLYIAAFAPGMCWH